MTGGTPAVASVVAPPVADDGAPLNYFLHSHGPASEATMHLGWVLAACVSLVCLIVAGLLAYAIWRRRSAGANADTADAAQPSRRDLVHSSGNGLRAVAIGTGISTLLLFALAAYSLVVLGQVGAPPRTPPLTLTVTGYDWWWRIDYDDGPEGKGFVTANEIHIPVGLPVRLRLASADVIHAFWVPQLAGKTQMIPGVRNEQWLQADAPGIYRGQCTQFCGVQHAHMAMEVVAQSPADYARWRAAQGSEVAAPAAGAALAGRTLFVQRCGGCHAVRGTQALGEHGPDLTHLGARRLIGAGLLSNTPAHLLDWVAHVQKYKPGARMPDMALNAGEAASLGAFLSTLD